MDQKCEESGLKPPPSVLFSQPGTAPIGEICHIGEGSVYMYISLVGQIVAGWCEILRGNGG